jgi:hypothetical protein
LMGSASLKTGYKDLISPIPDSNPVSVQVVGWPGWF